VTAIQLRGVSKNFGRVQAVVDLTLAIPEGSLYGLIGPNGAGKTTTFGMLSGFLRPTSGEVLVRGQQLSTTRPPVGHVLALPQDAALPPGKRVRSVLVHLARLGGMSKDDAIPKANEALGKVGLGELGDRKVGQLSHGQRRRVGIAQTLVGANEVILLDEPTAGLDPRTAIELGALIKELHGDRTIVLSSHNLAEVESLCTHAAILDRGRLVASGSMDEIKGTGQLLFVELARPVEDPAPLVEALSKIATVGKVTPNDEKDKLAVECTDAEKVDDVTNQVLQALIANGASVKGVERGKRLEERFMETTTQSE
jgi:ABC-type multidrug transport system ATPase subunit